MPFVSFFSAQLVDKRQKLRANPLPGSSDVNCDDLKSSAKQIAKCYQFLGSGITHDHNSK